MGEIIEGSDFAGRYIIGLLEARQVPDALIGPTPSASSSSPATSIVAVRYRILNRTQYPMAPRKVNRLMHISDGQMSWSEDLRSSSLISHRMRDASPDTLLAPDAAATTWVAYDIPEGLTPCSVIFADGYFAARHVLGLPAQRSRLVLSHPQLRK